jgi:hypothetical protein
MGRIHSHQTDENGVKSKRFNLSYHSGKVQSEQQYRFRI